MRTYIYTQDASGNRQVTMPADDATLELILQGAPVFNHVIGDTTWNSGGIDPKTGERGEDVRLITLTPESLDLQGQVLVLDEVMKVAVQLKPGGRIWL